ncbi:MAG: hypothetical protein LBD53_04315 [Tannerella sp.]|nr:hypothetical protein [Tannerella sp.]
MLQIRNRLQEKGYINKHDENNRFEYFENHFGELGLFAVVIEHDYRDRQYLEDHSRYYSRCFKHYSRRCARLHFFIGNNEIAFDKPTFESYVLGSLDENEVKNVESTYAGFVTIKPIPKRVFGKTCVKTFPQEGKYGSTRHYTTIRPYKITLFGRDLTINSVAFQEQDHQVFACATAALWHTFQVTSKLFKHLVPSPYEITVQATGMKRAGQAGREGLTSEQIVNALSKHDMTPLVLELHTKSELQATVNAYLKAKIPIIIGGTIFEKHENGQFQDTKERHAITALGYNKKEEDTEIVEYVFLNSMQPSNQIAFYSKSALIEKIYVHDDQIGAFVSLTIEEGIKDNDGNIKLLDKNNKETSEKHIILTCKDRPNTIMGELLLIIPLYHKIRLPFKTIINEIIASLNTECGYNSPDLTVKAQWDIYLTSIDQFRKTIVQRRKDNIYNFKKDEGEDFTNEILLPILTSSLPKYIWAADCYWYDDETAKSKYKLEYSLYFDATDMDNGRQELKKVILRNLKE